MDDKNMRYSILQTNKSIEELKMLYKDDIEIREFETIEIAREHGKGYEFDDHSSFYK